MSDYIITYEDALELVDLYKGFNFSKTEYMHGDYKIVTFTYFLCDFSHFERPIPSRPEVKGHDMRGVTFTFNKNGELSEQFLMLAKFFNLDQVETTQYHLVKDKKIVNVSTKEDGSLIAFMKLPNDEVFAKTIGGFDNEQVFAAMKLYNSDVLMQKYIKTQLDIGYTPLFEYVSWDNRIVLPYSKAELRFIGLRDNIRGDFHPASTLYYAMDERLTIATGVNFTDINTIIALSKTIEDEEGWVIVFDDGQMIKIKTEWYFRLHGIRTINIFREDFVIRNYLEENLDDIIGQMDTIEDEDAFIFIDNVKLAVDNFIKYMDKAVIALGIEYNEKFGANWVNYASNKSKVEFFRLTKTHISDPEQYNDKKIKYIIDKTKRLKLARDFVAKWNPTNKKIVNKWNQIKT